MRVHELAKELKLTSKELLARLPEYGLPGISSQLAQLSAEQAQMVRQKRAATAVTPPAASAAPMDGDAAPAAEPDLSVPQPGHIAARGPIIVRDLAPLLGLRPNIMIAELMKLNIFASISDKLDFKVAQQLAAKHGFKLEHAKKAEPPKPVRPKVERAAPAPEMPDVPLPRPPVVTFMGHVDHGKTSLLDYIRKTRVAAGEAGGITQHIGAYTVPIEDKQITFIDTPGHAAFTAMRARGANVTDIAVIVIAADEGIMPQTREAIQHARAANVCIMVALNKMDLPAANEDRVLGQLQAEGLAPEKWGGQVICCPVSATKGAGVDELLSMILLQADVLELKAPQRGRARGFVLEARMEPGMGPTATLLVKEGTLKVGDAVVCGEAWGRVKALINDRGVKVRTVGPSGAIKCLGLTAVPEPGMEFHVYADDREARTVAEERAAARRLNTLQAPKRGLSLDELLRQTDEGAAGELPLVIKADVQGTLEAIVQAIGEINSAKILSLIHI